MSELISYHLEDGIATLTLSNGKVKAISPDVITAFNAALDQAVTDRAVVIMGIPSIPFEGSAQSNRWVERLKTGPFKGSKWLYPIGKQRTLKKFNQHRGDSCYRTNHPNGYCHRIPKGFTGHLARFSIQLALLSERFDDLYVDLFEFGLIHGHFLHIARKSISN